MTHHCAFRSRDLWLFSILWTLFLVTAAIWLGDRPAPSIAQKEPLKLVRYVGEERPAPGALTVRNR